LRLLFGGAYMRVPHLARVVGLSDLFFGVFPAVDHRILRGVLGGFAARESVHGSVVIYAEELNQRVAMLLG
jgi:hypothetical protein